jgi:hypothetical protein
MKSTQSNESGESTFSKRPPQTCLLRVAERREESQKVQAKEKRMWTHRRWLNDKQLPGTTSTDNVSLMAFFQSVMREAVQFALLCSVWCLRVLVELCLMLLVGVPLGVMDRASDAFQWYAEMMSMFLIKVRDWLWGVEKRVVEELFGERQTSV